MAWYLLKREVGEGWEFIENFEASDPNEITLRIGAADKASPGAYIVEILHKAPESVEPTQETPVSINFKPPAKKRAAKDK